MTNNTIVCELCGLVCSMQVSASHLRAKHNMTTKEYRALGYKTLSEARLEQLRNSPVSKGTVNRLYGENHWNWKGGYVSSAGYKILNVMGKKGVYEHRVAAEEMLGRPLTADEVVHHIDGNRLNNSSENLVVMKRREHDKIKDATRAYFHTTDECVEAAKTLFGFGWPKAKIQRALRIHHSTLSAWLKR